jgi:hypothetical protein
LARRWFPVTIVDCLDELGVVIWNSTSSSTNDDDQLVVDALERLDRVRRRRSVLLSYRIESVEPGLNLSNAWSTSSRVSVTFPTEGDTR